MADAVIRLLDLAGSIDISLDDIYDLTNEPEYKDWDYVLKEMYRVLTPNSKAYLILGDSAPYGVYVPTTRILGEISQSLGFGDYEIYKIRGRGNKWKNLKNRHSVELSENILILSR